MTTAHTIEAALLALSDRDQDMAREQNAVGFNGRDTNFGNSLAQQLRSGGTLSPRQRAAAHRMLRTYRAQLSRYGIDYDAIPVPDAPPVKGPAVPWGERKQAAGPDSTPVIRVADDGRSGTVLFARKPGDAVLSALKSIPGRTYDPQTRAWSVPLNPASLDAVMDFARTYGAAVEGAERISEAHARFERSVEKSAALDADVAVDGLGLTLMPFQRAGVAYALEHLGDGKGVYICDEMGLGKTPQSLAVVQARGLYPVLAVVPKVVWLNWAREAAKWVPGRRVALLAGKNVSRAVVAAAASVGATVATTTDSIPADAEVVVVNYDILSKWARPAQQGRSWTCEGPLADFPFRAIVFDEAHLLKERKALRTRTAIGLVKRHAGASVLALSGTPVPNRPSELITVVKDILNRLPEVGGWSALWEHHCEGWPGGARDLDGLNRKMRASFYVRRVKADVLPELPPVQWSRVAVEMSDPKRYYDVEADIAAWIRERLAADSAWRESLEGLSDEAAHEATDREADARAALLKSHEVLVKMGALRQVAADEKLPAVAEWLEEFLESTRTNGTGEKIIVFGIHRSVNEKLAERFGAPIIYGGMDSAARFEAERKFQEDPYCRVLVCSVDAAGVGLTLTAATHVAFVEVPWRPMDLDQAVARAYGRLSDLHGVNAYVLTVPGTIEDRIVDTIERKRDLTGAVSDGTSVAAAVAAAMVAEAERG